MLKAIILAYRQYAIYKATHRELETLSDKELRDIGIDRSMIEMVATEAAYGNEAKPSVSILGKLFTTKTEKQRMDEYLADSANLVDLENRIKQIDRGLAPWQVSGKLYAQGWL